VDEKHTESLIVHAADDVTVDVDNSINYFEALRAKKFAGGGNAIYR
jgi:dipeptidyl aminopeptidase/acylaminoacyl peptidase